MPPQPLTVAGRPAIQPTIIAPKPVAPVITTPQPTQTTQQQPASGGLDPRAILAAKAIRQVESGGNYSAAGKSGEFGAYQFLPSTWSETAPKYGINVPLSQATREQQNEVAVKTINDWITSGKATNIGQVASMWNAGAGKPNAYLEGNAGVNSKGVSYDTPAYAKNVAVAYQALKSGQTNGSSQTQPTAPSAPDNPNATTQAPAQNEDLLSRASDLFNTIFPNKNIGEALGTELAKLTVPENQRQYIAPSTATAGGITGDLLGDAAWLVGGGEAAPAIEEASTLGRIGSAALKGAKAGAIGGTLSGAGNALSNGGNIIDAGTGALTGGLTGGLAGGALGGVLAGIPKLAGRVANRGIQSESNVADELTRNSLGGNGTFNQNFQKAAPKFEANAAKADETAGAIVQGTKQEASQAVPVLNSINTNGVKTYSELSDRIQQGIDAHQTTVEQELSANATPVKLSQLGQKVEAGAGASKLTRTVNYVKDAMTQLKQFYTKTGNTKDALGIQVLENKARTTGITPKEINDLAKEHGRVLNGFNANGELASGLSKQAAENTRTGLKETARSFLKSDVAKQADRATSELIRVKGLVDDVGDKVNKLAQRVQKRGLLAKAGRAVGKITDAATGGFVKQLFQALTQESNVGLKSFNSLDIEARLQRNLKILKRLNGSTDTDVENFFRAIIGQLVTKR